MEVQVRDVREQAQYEASSGDRRLGIAQYRLRETMISFLHTEVAAEFRGRGIAARLIEAALQDAEARGLEVLPFCPFVRRYIEEHPAFLKLVPEDRRGAFGLPS